MLIEKVNGGYMIHLGDGIAPVFRASWKRVKNVTFSQIPPLKNVGDKVEVISRRI